MLLKTQDQPLSVLARYCRRMLDSAPTLSDFVRDVDVEWGRAMDERPHLDKDGAAPHQDDPSVRGVLTGLLEQLKAGGAS